MLNDKNTLTTVGVTTLIDRYTSFDEEFWLGYKALDALCDEDFKPFKSQILKTKRFLPTMFEELGVSNQAWEDMKADIKYEWEEKRQKSCDRGNAIHKEQEALFTKAKVGGGVYSPKKGKTLALGTLSMYSEFALSYTFDNFILRGIIDLVLVNENTISLTDYKTNNKIDTKGYFDQSARRKSCMRYPLSNIEDCNFKHYSLQLSLYAYLVELNYPEITINTLTIEHHEPGGGIVDYECEYLKADVIRLLNFYKKEVINDNFNKARQKMVF